MDKKEIMDAVTAINLDMIQAEHLVNRAGHKLKAVMSQLAIDWREDLTKGVAELHAQATAHVHQGVDGKTYPAVPHPHDPMAGTSLAAAVTGLTPEGIDFTSLSLKDVPQSPASRLEVVPTSSPAAAKPAAVPKGPTREIPPEERRRPPQPENPARTPDPHREKYQEQLGHFTGNGSLFSRYLSPAIMVSGKGFLKPGVAGLEQYSDDVLQLTPQRMAEWPSGFYRDRNSSEVQFMLVSQRGIVVVPMLPKNDQIPMVALGPISAQSQLIAVNELPMMDLLMLKDSIEAELKRLSDTVQV